MIGPSDKVRPLLWFRWSKKLSQFEAYLTARGEVEVISTCKASSSDINKTVTTWYNGLREVYYNNVR